MKEQTILRYEVLNLLATGELFDLVFITADRKRGTGGDLKEVSGYRKVMAKNVEARVPGQFAKVSTVTRDPNHNQHKTFNIYNPSNEGDHTITVHWRLMVFFNHKRIIG